MKKETQFYKVETNIQGIGTIYVAAPSYFVCVKILLTTKDLAQPINSARVCDFNISAVLVLREATNEQ